MTYLFPVIVLAGFGLYYMAIYRKGKAAGGGMMEGFAAAAQDKWREVLEPGETIIMYGNGIVWRPAWQVYLAGQIPLLRLVWPATMYAFALTDRERVFSGKYGTLGGISEQKAHATNLVRIERAEEEKPGAAMKLNPMYRANPEAYATYDATLSLSGESLHLVGVPAAFLNSLRHGGPTPAAVAARSAPTAGMPGVG